MISVEASVLDVEQGHIRRIVIGNELYEVALIGVISEVDENDIREAEEYIMQHEQEEAPQLITDSPKKGQIIKTVDDIPIYENIYYDIRQQYIKKKGIDFSSVLKKYYPEYDDNVLSQIEQAYRHCIGGVRTGNAFGEILYKTKHISIYKDIVDAIENSNEPVEKILRQFYPHVKYKTIISYANRYRNYLNDRDKIEEKIERKNNQSKDGRIGYDDSYRIVIMQDDIQEIKRLLHRFNYIATVESMVKETGFSKQKIRGLLHWMIEEKMVKRNWTTDGVAEYVPL